MTIDYKWFPAKNRSLICRQDRSANKMPGFLAGNHLNSYPDSDLRKKLTLILI